MLDLADFDALNAALCRARLLDWAEYVIPHMIDGASPAAHHRLLLSELQWLADTPGGRLLVMMPPGSAKSTYASVVFPAWFLARGNRAVIGASHTADLAEKFSRDVQRIVAEHSAVLGCGLASQSVQAWLTTNGGQYKAAGVGGPITGRRADLAVIDDPVKNREEAESQTIREKAWGWFWADLMTRLKPGGRILLIMTRWHEDDLAGRLLAAQTAGWRVIRLPALAEDNDPLGREPGAPLWGDDGYGFGADLLAKKADLEQSGQTRDWASLFQQSPRPMEGALFKVAMMGTDDAIPNGRAVVRAWDLAATAQVGTRDPDWTVGLKLMRTDTGRFVVLDVVRFRGAPEEVERAIMATAERDGRLVQVSIPQDPGQAGKAQAERLTRMLAGYRVHCSPETGDKATRAAPAIAQVNVGNFAVLRAPWNRVFLDELAAFPAGAKDDQVDALSRAFMVLAEKRSPMVISDAALRGI